MKYAMEQELRLGTTIAGNEFKVLIGRHCTRNLVFYSIELPGQYDKGCHFMIYDRVLEKYRLIPAPAAVSYDLSDHADELSTYIMKYFHSHCLN